MVELLAYSLHKHHISFIKDMVGLLAYSLHNGHTSFINEAFINMRGIKASTHLTGIKICYGYLFLR